jgi:hypothetical protein
MKTWRVAIPTFAVGLILIACSGNQSDKADAAVKDPTKETFSLSTLVEEVKQVPDSVVAQLNAQHHNFKVLERRSVPGPFVAPAMKYYSDYAVTLDKLPTINPPENMYTL